MINGTRVVFGKLLKTNPSAGALLTVAEVEKYSSVIVNGVTTAGVVYTLPAPSDADVAANTQILSIKNGTASTQSIIITTVNGSARIEPGRHEVFAYDSVGAGWYAATDDEGSPIKVEQNLVVGNNVFVHNLGTTDVDAVTYTLKHIATGHTMDLDLVSATANDITFYSNIATTTPVRLTIIG